METPIEHPKKAAVDASARDGSLVSDLADYNLMKIANRSHQSAGVCAAVKTSKVPITVKATTDITCDCPSACFVLLGGR